MKPCQDRNITLTGGEYARGGLLFALYAFAFPAVMAWVQCHAGEELPPAESGVIYHLIAAVLVFLFFWRYLRRSFDVFLDGLPRSLGTAALGAAAWVVLDFLVRRIPLPVEDPNDMSSAMEYLLSPAATAAVLLVLMPLVEEMLFRGVLMNALRRHGRAPAYLISALAYAVFSVWQFVFSYGAVDLRYLLLAVRRLPAALLLAWCCDRGGFWSAVLLHGAVNGFTLLRVVNTVGVL